MDRTRTTTKTTTRSRETPTGRVGALVRGVGWAAATLAIPVTLALHPQALAAQDPPPAPDPADVASVDGIIAAVYASISGPAGQPRDWDRFRSLMAPGARLIPTGPTPTGGVGHRVLTPEDYIEAADPGLVGGGFFEVEIGRVMERYGPVAHLMSAYESRRAADDPEPFARGVNSFQLLHDGDRWWVVTIFWASETPDRPIPERLLGTGGR